jgi:hypothetical protein
MSVDWDALRDCLGIEYGPGSWFCVSEGFVRLRSGRQFANKDGERRVLQATRPGPTAVLYPRSTTIPGPFEHAKHAHPKFETLCRIDRDGWVQLDVPVTVRATTLCQESYSCAEPEGTGLLEAVRKAIVP